MATELARDWWSVELDGPKRRRVFAGAGVARVGNRLVVGGLSFSKAGQDSQIYLQN